MQEDFTSDLIRDLAAESKKSRAKIREIRRGRPRAMQDFLDVLFGDVPVSKYRPFRLACRRLIKKRSKAQQSECKTPNN